MFPIPHNSAHDFWKLGLQFQMAARLVFEKESFAPNFPGCTLIGQAIELYLKAYLRNEGESIEGLKGIGHDLKKALERAEKEKLSEHLKLESGDRQNLDKFSRVYQSKDFQYAFQGDWDIPTVQWLLNFAEKLSKSVKLTLRN